jgi:radical SAM protein with 4Fe4S-binding SPASM domain
MFLIVEPAHTCNLRCIHCVHGYDDLKAKYAYTETMERAFYDRLIDEAAHYGCPSLSLNNINEPLMGRDLVDRIRYAADRGIQDIMITTNAVLLTERMSEALLESGLTRLQVSLDAATRETYARVRRNSNYDKVRANVDRFLELRAKRNARVPVVRMSMVRMSVNEHEITDFIKQWSDTADYIAIQEFSAPEPNRAEFEALLADSRMVLGEFRCPQPWQRLIVLGDGSVLPCCSQFAQELTLGNARQTPIRDLWMSERMHRLRDLHRRAQHAQEPTCARCVSTWVGRPKRGSCVTDAASACGS